MGLYVGIDGGGTKTKCVLADDQLKILAEAEAGPTNPLAVGVDKSSEILFELIQNVSKKESEQSITSVVIGLAGAGRKKIAGEIENRLKLLVKRKKVSIKNIKVLSDVEIALEGAFAGALGIILIAGTGSIVFGKNKNGELFRAGGFGKVIGDEGSGYSIGKKALQLVSKEFDGRGSKTFLTTILGKKFGIKNRDDLITAVYSSGFDIARFAEHVIAAAQLGDKIARNILADESDELICHVETLYKQLGEKKMSLCLSGGLLSSKNYYSNLLRRKIKKVFGDIEIKKNIYPPEIGAAVVAKKFRQ
ncbi:MAG: hypothetical protein M1495_17090 [Bacteroidetes bacterium]|nr:hypothetical protein [Bacteroidota bacterium]